jgi:L-lactate utilization protein LutC
MSREAVLDKVRRAALRRGSPDPDRAQAVETRLAARAAHAPVPEIARTEGAARLDRFEARAKAADAGVTRVPDVAALPAALAEELRRRNLPAMIRTGADPLFRELDWGAVERSEGVGRIDEPATLSRAELAVAETGSLALCSGPDNPVTLTFLGETHFAALRAADVVDGFESLWSEFRRRALDPRTLNLVTGPSRSADIGQTLQLGAHGPVALHVFLIEG